MRSLLLTLAFSWFLINLHEAKSSKLRKDSNDFDYLVFRQIWPPPTCMFPGKNTCSISMDVKTWVIHGLWPSIKSSLGPTFCNKSMPFNFDSIKWLETELLDFWPNLYTNTPLDSFWQHEWEKHGTCALSLPQVKNESDYFNLTLGLRNHFDFGPILKANDIVPDDTVLYDLDKIKEAIKKVLSVEPVLECYVLKDSSVQYLSQMQVCLSKSFQLIDCSNTHSTSNVIMSKTTPQETRCQHGLPIHYPTFHYSTLVKSLQIQK